MKSCLNMRRSINCRTLCGSTANLPRKTEIISNCENNEEGVCKKHGTGESFISTRYHAKAVHHYSHGRSKPNSGSRYASKRKRSLISAFRNSKKLLGVSQKQRSISWTTILSLSLNRMVDSKGRCHDYYRGRLICFCTIGEEYAGGGYQ